MSLPPSPWIRKKSTIPLSPTEPTVTTTADVPKESNEHYLPSLLVDALGGGRRPTKSPKKASPSTIQRKQSSESIYSPAHLLDEDAPPSQSLFCMSPGDMKAVDGFSHAPAMDSALGQSLGDSAYSGTRSVSGSFAGSPMDLDRSHSLPHSPLYTPSQSGHSAQSGHVLSPAGITSQGPSTPLKSQTTVTLIGFPPAKWRQVLDFAKTMDTLVSFRKSDDANGNWMVVTFATSKGVTKIKDYDGQLFDGSWFLAVKFGDAAVGAQKPPTIQVAGSLMSERSTPSQVRSPLSTQSPNMPTLVSKKNTLNLGEPLSPLAPSPLVEHRRPGQNIPRIDTGKSSARPATSQSPLWTQQENSNSTLYMDEEDSVRPSVWHKVMDILFGW